MLSDDICTQVHVYTYDMELANVPSGALLKDAHSILPNDTAEQPYKHIQTFADLFRYELLKKFGGWWLDLDLPLLRPLDHASPYCFATELEEKTPKVMIVCSISRFLENDLATET